jgi:hypothetical protein
MADPNDQEPPSVVAMTPNDGAGEIPIGTPVVITFDEPMEPYATQAAVTISPKVVVLSETWNDDYTELTIAYDLAYGEAMYPETPEIPSYRVTVTSVATDASGNALPTAGVTTFSTKGRTLHVFDVVQDLVGHTSDPYVGNWSWLGGGAYSSKAYHGFLSFDISAFPEELADNVESAVIDTEIWRIDGTPFDIWGDLSVEHSNFAVEQDADDAPMLRDLGVMIYAASEPAVGDLIKKEVTEAFASDIDFRAQRNNLSQYLLRFQGATEAPTSATNMVYVSNKSTNGYEGDNRIVLVVSTLSSR